MTNYQKIWGTVFGLIILVIFGLLIYSEATSENGDSILTTISNPESKSVRNILIAPQNPEWKINLTIDTLTVNDKKDVDDVIFGLKTIKEKRLAKGAKRFWVSNLIINFAKSNTVHLKNKERIIIRVLDTEEGLYVELTNTMGFTTYACQPLKPLLERLTNYQKPLGGKN